MRIFFVLICFLILVLSIFFVKSIDNDSENLLVKGKNYISFSGIDPLYVSDLIKLNPGIEVVSYGEGEDTFGYVNVFGGIGKNFIIRDLQEYEIISKEDTALIFPNDIKENAG